MYYSAISTLPCRFSLAGYCILETNSQFFFVKWQKKDAVVNNAWIRYDANLKVDSSQINFSSNKKEFCVTYEWKRILTHVSLG